MPVTIRRSSKITKVCGQCNLHVNESEDESIECDKCAQIFHVICTNLDKRQYQYLLQNAEEDFFCNECNGASGNCNIVIENEIKEIKTSLKKLDKIQDSIEFMSKQYDTLIKSVAENSKKLIAVQKENICLKNEVATLKESVKILNDQRVKNDCIIRGLEVKNNISAVGAVLDLTKSVGVDLTENSISDAYFFKNRNENNAKKTMVVKFENKTAKDKFMMAKPKLKENEATKSVYVNDYLSKETLKLFNYAKTLKTVGYRSIYTNGARVYVKMSELSHPRCVHNEDDVDKMLSEAVTRRKSGSRRNVEQNESDGESTFKSPALH